MGARGSSKWKFVVKRVNVQGEQTTVRKSRATAALVGVFAFLTCWVPSATAHLATGIVVDRAGRIYVTDPFRNRVLKFEADGRTTVVAEMHVSVLAMDSQDSLYIVERGVWRVSPDGKMTEILRPGGSESPGWPVAVDSRGNIYLRREDGPSGRMQIFKLSPQGTALVLTRDKGTARDPKLKESLAQVSAAACAPDGSLYIKDNNRLRRVAADGSITTLTEELLAGLKDEEKSIAARRTLGLAADAAGNAYLADYVNRRVPKIGPDGRRITLLRSPWPWVPTGIAVGPEGVYVLEFFGDPYGLPVMAEAGRRLADSPRVRRISPDGRITTVRVAKNK